MRKAVFLLFCVILILIFAIFYFWKSKGGEICFENNCYFIEEAKTQEEREKGLSYRDSLGADKVMLFIFEEEGFYPFWMKNMRFPIDIIWLDKDYKVVYLVENVKPCDAGACQIIYPDQNAQYVLEINAGEAGKIGLKEGNMMILKK